MDRTNAERQHRDVQRLKQRSAAPHGPDEILAALAGLQPQHFLNGTVAPFAHRVIAEAERLLAVSDVAMDGPPATASNAEPTAPSSGHRPVERMQSEILAVLKRNKWNHLDNGLPDRIALGELFLEAREAIHAGLGPRPAAFGSRKAWQTNVDNQMRRFVEQCKKQPGYNTPILTYASVKRFFIKEAMAARRAVGR